MGKILDMRRTMGSQDVLPQGIVPIEYLESSGTQYIDTKIVLENDNFEIKTQFCFTESVSGENPIISTWGHGWQYFNLFVRSNNSLDLYIGNHCIFPSYIYKNTNYNVSIKRNQGVWSLSLDNTPYGGGYSGIGNRNSLKFFVRSDLGSFSAHIRIYTCEVYISERQVGNFIPVRVGQVGYMYDKVSGQLFGNAGTGAFILGADKVGGGKYLIINMLCDYSAERRVA